MIPEELLLRYRAKEVSIAKKEVLFYVDSDPKYFYQVLQGKVKMNYYNEDGKEFIQGIFGAGSSFGEPPLFQDLGYPAQAEAVVNSTVWKLEKAKFLKLLEENPKVHLELTKVLASRLHYKATMVAEISTENPEHRLLKLMDYFKFHIHNVPKEEPYMIELSRQQMADLTGLRVETVIRAIKSLEKKGEVTLSSHKILR